MTKVPDSIAGLSAEEKRKLASQLLQARARSRQSIEPLSQNQLAMWLHYRLEPGSSAYNIAFSCRVHSQINLDALRNALKALTDRHSSLRTLYSDATGDVQAIVRGELEPLFVIEDVAHLSEADLFHHVEKSYQQPINLEEGPLLRSYLFKRSDTDHVLLLVASHISLDGWSYWILLDELKQLYAANCEGRSISLPPLAATYTDFTRWQRELLSGPEGEELWQYWKNELSGELPVLNLPLDRPRPTQRRSRGAGIDFVLDREDSQSLRQIARDRNTTLFTLALTLWQVLLYRYSGQDQIIVGCPTAGRSRPEFSRLIGNCISAVPIRLRIPAGATFDMILSQVKSKVLDALANQDFPHSEMLRRLDLWRDPSIAPIYQSTFDMQRTQNVEDPSQLFVPGNNDVLIPFGPLQLSSYLIPQQEGQSDFSLQFMEHGADLLATIKYNSDILDHATAERAVSHFRLLVKSVIEDDRLQKAGHLPATIDRLPIVSEADLSVLQPLIGTHESDGAVEFVHHGFEARAKDCPASTAVVAVSEDLTWREEITYADLDRRANALAQYLHDKGTKPGDLIAICMTKSVDLMVGVLGVLKAGMAYLPLDPSYPPQRIAGILEESQAPFAIVHAATASLIPDAALTVIDIADAPRTPADGTPGISVSTNENDLAYVTYTSGSTGKPKGVMIEHGSFARALHAWLASYPLPSVRRHLQLANIGFDVFSADWTKALCHGASLILCPREIMLDPPRLAELIDHEEVESAEFVPAALKALVDHLETSGQTLNTLRVIYCGSDAWTAGDFRRFKKALGPAVRLINTYGITETTIDNCCYEEVDPGLADSEPLPIGKPFPNTRMYILNPAWQPQPLGVAGELFLGGSCVARGYLNKPALTAERFVQSPPELNVGRLYKTGDMARVLPDGNIQFLGRADSQIKLRGFRIEPGEIEAVISAHPEVRQSVVLARQSDAGDKRLVAYVVLNESVDESAVLTDLRQRVAESLPEYMNPAAYVFIEQIPLNASGKIDRNQLPSPDFGQVAPSAEPRTTVEKTIAEIWSAVLGVSRIGLHDNFFQLGGHSLLATQVVTRLREAYKIELPLRAIFEAPALVALADRVESLLKEEGVALAPPIQPREAGEKPVISFAQERMWFLQEIAPESGAYNIPVAARMHGLLDIDAFVAALNFVVERHEILRAQFRAEDGSPVVDILPQVTIRPHLVDLRDLPQAEREDRAAQLAIEEAGRPFNLASDPMLRIAIFILGDEDHVVVATAHHIVSDQWSIGLLVNEWTDAYTSMVAGAEPQMAPLAVQYSDYAKWQRNWLRGEVLDSQLAYWKQKLGGELPVIDLPSDRPRPAVQTYRGAKVFKPLTPELSTAIRTLSHSHGSSIFMTMLAAFKAQLSRLMGLQDIIVGTPIAGRTQQEIESLIGFFINTLVLRTDLSGNPTFKDVLGRVRETALGAYAHQDMPFAKIVAELHPDRDLSRTPLFQVFFNHLSAAPQLTLELPNLQVEPFGQYEPESKFDLTLYSGEKGDRIELMAVYNADLFDATRIEELLAQYEQFLTLVTARPESRIAEVSLVTQASATTLPDPAEKLRTEATELLLQRVQRVVEQRASSVAIRHDGAEMTYLELDRHSNQLAQSLISGGVVRGDIVLVCAPRCSALAPALLGVMKSGAAFSILDPAYPLARLVERAEMVGAKALVFVNSGTDQDARILEALRALVPSEPILLTSDFSYTSCANASDSSPSVEITGDDIAYVAFTSGTTGKPKAVVGTHAPLAHFLEWETREFGITAADRFSVLSGLAHDPLLRDLFAPVWSGATACVPDAEWIHSPSRLVDWMRQEEISICHLTPAMGSLMTQVLVEEPQQSASGDLNKLRLACFGGEALSPRLVSRFHALAPSAEIVNYYGAMETPQAMSFHRHAPMLVSDGQTELPVSLGSGIDDVQLLVLNGNSLCGIGEIGEIVIRTAFLTRGYLNDPSATAERFMQDPFDSNPSVRLYRTGDLGRYDPDGSVMFCGRRDRQVQLRGFRIELAEIESVLSRLPEVVNCSVVLHEDGNAEPRIVAYVVGRNGIVDVDALRAWSREQMPEHMVPSAFVPLESIPLTANGKVDYRALPIPARVAASGYVAPRTATEEKVSDIWKSVLRIDQMGVADNFFALGGHSLLATQVMSRIHKTFGIELPLRTLFERPTVASLSSVIDSAGVEPKTTAITARPASRSHFLSFSQERMWFIHQLAPESSAYNIAGLTELNGPLDADAFERSVNAVAQRHDVLRSTFPAEEGIPCQVVHEKPCVSFDHIDLRGLPQATRMTDAVRLGHELIRRTFNLATGPLSRMALYRVADDQHVFAISMHHIISDQWSMRVFGHELVRFYTAYTEGTDPALPEMAIQYSDYSAWQRQWMQGEVLQKQMGYWKQKLAAPPVLELPTDRPRPAIQRFRGARQMMRMPADTAEKVRKFSAENSATPFMVLVAAFKVLLARYTGQKDIVIGAPIANRNRYETENLLGTFVNLLALRSDVSANPSFVEFVQQVRDTMLDAYANQDLPFERLVDELQPQRDISHSPIFQAMFNLVNSPSSGARFSNLLWKPLSQDRGASQYDLTMVVDLETTRSVMVEYDTDLFDPPTIQRLLQHYLNFVESALSNPAQPVASIPLLGPEEIQTQIVEWNDTRRDYAREKTAADLFAEQAMATPERKAVNFQDRSLSYAQLHHRSNQLAHHLRALGVGRNDYVGIYMERSPEMLVALLGVMKAGAAYLPLDPGFPPDRLSFMVEETAAPVILTDRALVASVPGRESQIIVVDEANSAYSGESSEEVPRVNEPEDLAYVIFTSGSTGKPKGVQIPHRALTNFLQSMQEQPGLSRDDVLLAVTTLSFDIAGLELFLPLITGATIELASREAASDATVLTELIGNSDATVMQATPATWRMLIDSGWQGSAKLKVLCGGEALSKDLAQDLLQRCRVLWNMYGPTETTIWSSVERVETASDRISIGKPIANTVMHILDEKMQPVPLGVAGELLIGGEGVAVGYLKRPELTAEKYISSPFDPAIRLYRTGDLARYLPDGRIECVGRIDHQVKIRGFRIELGEIESALVDCPQVEKAVVIAREDQPGDKRLVAYVVAANGTEPSLTALRPLLKRTLPDYMVPSAVVVMDAFPLTPNGKIDRRALPAPDRSLGKEQTEYVAPRTPLEQTLASIWQELLRVERVGVNDNFFDLGGHSLLATQVISRLRKSDFPVDLPLRVLFEHPTIGEIAPEVMSMMAGQQDETELTSLMDMVKNLSPEELASRLEQLQRP